MRFVVTALVLALAALPLVACLAAPACAQPAALRLNEVMPGPSRDWNGDGVYSSRDDEWVEVVNASGAPLDLAGWIVTDGDSLPRYALDGTLAPGAVALVTGKMSYDWEKANGKPAYGLALGNSGDAVLLWHVEGADTVLVDAYAYKAHEAAADRAIGRVPDGTGEWVLLDSLNPYTGSLTPKGTGCAPTPGGPNACSLTPARASSWGRVKTIYR